MWCYLASITLATFLLSFDIFNIMNGKFKLDYGIGISLGMPIFAFLPHPHQSNACSTLLTFAVQWFHPDVVIF